MNHRFYKLHGCNNIKYKFHKTQPSSSTLSHQDIQREKVAAVQAQHSSEVTSPQKEPHVAQSLIDETPSLQLQVPRKQFQQTPVIKRSKRNSTAIQGKGTQKSQGGWSKSK